MGAPAPVTPIVKKWAYAAAGSYINYPIPQTTADPGKASYELGTPPLTMTDKDAGGVPPLGQDYNGVLQQVTENIVYQTAGQLYKYDAGVSTALGGYQQGAVLAMADNTGLWISLINANTDNPDTGSVNWAPLYRYDYTPLPVTGGVVALSFLQARAPVIVLTGALVSNLQLVLPNLLQEWRIVNQATGAFTTTVRTAAGTGVLVPQGGFANATPVYGNGVDIFYDSSPTTIAASVSPVPNTILQRDNAGVAYATKFDDLTDMVNTFGARNLAGTGYYTLPGGLKIQWGTLTASADGETAIAYPVAFTAFSRPVVSGGTTAGNVQDNWPAVSVGSATLTGFRVINRLGSILPNTYWIAVGV